MKTLPKRTLGVSNERVCIEVLYENLMSSSFSISLETAITRSLPPMEAMTEVLGHLYPVHWIHRIQGTCYTSSKEMVNEDIAVL